LLLLSAGAAAGCSQAKAYEKPLTPARVETVRAYVPGGAVGARYSATIKPATQIDLAFKQAGYVRELMQVRGADGRMRDLQEGDRVPKGATLARLREDDFSTKVSGAEAQVSEAQSSLGTSKAQLSEAEAGMRQAQRDLERATALLESESLTKPEHEAAKTKFEMAQAKVEAARAQTQVIQAKINSAKATLSEAQMAKGDATLRAPMDCVVLRRAAERGSLVAPGAPILTLAEADAFKAVFGAPDLTVSSLKLGAELPLTTEAIPGVEMRGLVTRIGAAADARTRVFEVEVTILHPPSQLRTGMIASLTAPDSAVPADPVVVAPLGAIIRAQNNSDSYAVNVVSEENGRIVARRRAVKLGEAYGNLIGVTEGLQAGEQIIVTGAAAVTDGEPIQITQ
jgi:RND family efflux transporter MFP subunit